MKKYFIPNPPQHPMIDHMIMVKRCALWASMGIGKTSAVLYFLSLIKESALYTDPVLVVAPKKPARETWPSEIEKWTQFVKAFTYSVVWGDIKKRGKALASPADIYITTYDNAVWFRKEAGKRKFSIVVFDESTKLKAYRRTGGGGSRARALKKIADNADRVIELTGTPAGNGLYDLWGQLYLLDRGKRLGDTLNAFVQRWFSAVLCGSFTKIEPHEFAMDQIVNEVKDICLSVRSEDYFDLKKPIEVEVPVRLPPSLYDKYKEFERELYLELKTKSIEAVSAADKSNKCLQLCSGAVYTNRKRTEWEVLHNEKLDALESIIEEANGESVIVVYQFKHEVPRILKRFKKAVLFTDKPGILKRWNQGSIPILLLHAANAGHGLNMQDGGRIIIFFTLWWNMELTSQVIERIGPMRQLQSGYKRSVFIYYIIMKSTIDERVLLRHRLKCSVDEVLRLKTREE